MDDDNFHAIASSETEIEVAWVSEDCIQRQGNQRLSSILVSTAKENFLDVCRSHHIDLRWNMALPNPIASDF